MIQRQNFHHELIYMVGFILDPSVEIALNCLHCILFVSCEISDLHLYIRAEVYSYLEAAHGTAWTFFRLVNRCYMLHAEGSAIVYYYSESK